MNQETQYWVEIYFKKDMPRIERVIARNETDVRDGVRRKYGMQYADCCILSEGTQSKLVYIASPYAGDIAGNTQFAIRCCQYAVHRGYTPIAPHLLYPQMLDDADPVQRAQGLALGHRILEACDELWVFGERISDGMAGEIVHAKEHCIGIRYIQTIPE